MVRIKTAPLAAGALALALSTAAQAASKEIDGYRPERATLAASLPVHIVALNRQVRPQIDYVYQDVSRYTPGYPGGSPQFNAGMSTGQAIGVNVLGSLIASAIVNSAAYSKAKSRAVAAYEPLQHTQCDLPIDAPLQQAVRDAIARASWGAATTVTVTDGEDDTWEKRIPKDQPRQIFTITSSLSPGLTGLVTSVDVAAYAPEGETKSAWQKKPLWRDHFIVVSDWLELPPKTTVEIEQLVAEENRRFVDSGAQAMVARVKEKGRAGRSSELREAADARKLHEKNLELAREESWSPEIEDQRRARLWSENGCARLRSAIDLAGVELGRMLDALYTQQLPARRSSKELDNAFERPGERQIRALPGGVYVSRNEGGSVNLDFRYSLLPLKESKPVDRASPTSAPGTDAAATKQDAAQDAPTANQ